MNNSKPLFDLGQTVATPGALEALAASGEQPGFKAFGITPAPLAATAPEWLGRFRKGGRFAPRTA